MNGAGEIVGMINWADMADPCTGGGTHADVIKAVLGFDQWYGTLTSGDTLKCN